MFGSAKYRNYRYGADDHVAVVHTEPTRVNIKKKTTAKSAMDNCRAGRIR